jgi:hypothetical protein
MIKRWANTIALCFLLPSSLAWAHGEHDPSGSRFVAPLWVWLVAGALLLVIAFVLVRQAKKGTLIGLAGPLMAMGDWQTAYLIGGGVLATAFVLYYLYFVRYDSRPVPVLQPAPAR